MLDHRSTNDLAASPYETGRVVTLPVLRQGLVLGDVRIEWELPAGFLEPVVWNYRGLRRRKWFATQCWIVYRYGEYSLRIPPRFEFDGPSTPRITWWRPSYAPMEAQVWSALPHDYICERPEVLPRGIGDAIFAHLSEQVAAAELMARRDAWRQSTAVRWYSRAKEVFGISA
jgi:hypothetical protein